MDSPSRRSRRLSNSSVQSSIQEEFRPDTPTKRSRRLSNTSVLSIQEETRAETPTKRSRRLSNTSVLSIQEETKVDTPTRRGRRLSNSSIHEDVQVETPTKRSKRISGSSLLKERVDTPIKLQRGMNKIEEEGEGVKKAAGRLDQLMAEEASLTPRRRSRRLSNTSITEEEGIAPVVAANKMVALDIIDEDAEEKEDISVPLKKRRVIAPICDLFDDDEVIVEPEVVETETIKEVEVNAEEIKTDDAFKPEEVAVPTVEEVPDVKLLDSTEESHDDSEEVVTKLDEKLLDTSEESNNATEDVAVVKPEVKELIPEKESETTEFAVDASNETTEVAVDASNETTEVAVDASNETLEKHIEVMPSVETVEKKAVAAEEDKDEQTSDKENSTSETKSDFEKAKLWTTQPMEDYFSHTQITKPKSNMLVKADIIPRQKPKSGKFWKAERKQFNNIKKDKGSRLTFDQRIKRKEDQAKSKELAELITNRKKQKKQEVREKLEKTKKQKEENEKKAEIHQVINNPNKMKKKQVQMLAKRDTLSEPVDDGYIPPADDYLPP